MTSRGKPLRWRPWYQGASEQKAAKHGDTAKTQRHGGLGHTSEQRCRRRGVGENRHDHRFNCGHASGSSRATSICLKWRRVDGARWRLHYPPVGRSVGGCPRLFRPRLRRTSRASRSTRSARRSRCVVGAIIGPPSWSSAEIQAAIELFSTRKGIDGDLLAHLRRIPSHRRFSSHVSLERTAIPIPILGLGHVGLSHSIAGFGMLSSQRSHRLGNVRNHLVQRRTDYRSVAQSCVTMRMRGWL